MAYIDRDKAIETAVQNYKGVTQFDAIELVEAMENIPAADVVEVVRCKDCGMFVDNKEALVTYCKRECKNLTVNPSDFCSYGERRDT